MPDSGSRGDRSRVVIERFDPGRHERQGFSCGVSRLDNFLRLSAKRLQKDGYTQVHVAVDPGSPRILGYCALNAHDAKLSEFGAGRPPRAPRSGSVPVVYLSMIAVDQSCHGRGIGSDLVTGALEHVRRAAHEIGIKAVILDVINDNGVVELARRTEFYRRLGFESVPERPERMYIFTDSIRSNLNRP